MACRRRHTRPPAVFSQVWQLQAEQEANHARLEHDLVVEQELEELEEEGVHLAAELCATAAKHPSDGGSLAALITMLIPGHMWLAQETSTRLAFYSLVHLGAFSYALLSSAIAIAAGGVSASERRP